MRLAGMVEEVPEDIFMVCYWWHKERKEGKEGEERKERRSISFRVCYVGTLAHIETGNGSKMCEGMREREGMREWPMNEKKGKRTQTHKSTKNKKKEKKKANYGGVG